MTSELVSETPKNGENGLPRLHAVNLLPLSPQSDAVDERVDSPGLAPDVSEPLEALVWRSEVFGGVRIPLTREMARFVRRRLPEIEAGVQGRGVAEVRDNGDLVVHFGLTPEDAETSLVDRYVTALREYLSLPPDHPAEIVVRETNLPEAVKAATDRDLRALGLRAVALSPISNELTTKLDNRS